MRETGGLELASTIPLVLQANPELRKCWKKVLSGCNSVSKKRTFKESPRLQNYDIFSVTFREALQKGSKPLHTSVMHNDSK